MNTYRVTAADTVLAFAAETNAKASEVAAAASAAQAEAARDEVLLYRTPADLVAATEPSRGSGSLWRAGAYQYEEVTTGEDLTTAAGVLLKVIPVKNTIHTSALNLTPNAEARDAVQKILDDYADSGVEIINDVDILVNQALLPRGGHRFFSPAKITANPTFIGTGATGACVAIRHENNLDIYLEHVDGNNVAISEGFNGVTVSAPQAPTVQRSTNIRVHVNLVENCLRDPAFDVGKGGGKGLSIAQFGSDQIHVTANVQNCDIPFSVEGRTADDGAVYNLRMEVNAKDCTYGPALIGSTGTGTPSEWPRYASGQIVTQLYDCGSATGALMFSNSAFNVDAIIISTTTIAKVVAGTLRGGVLNIVASAPNITDAIDHTEVLLGFTTAASRDYIANLKLQAAGSLTGALYRHDVANASVSSTIHAEYSYSGSGFPTLYAQTDDDFRYDITDVTAGKRIIGNGGSPAFQTSALSLQPSTLDLLGNAARVFQDGSNIYIECEAKDLVFRDKNGANQARVRNGEFVVQNRTRFGTSGTIIDTYGTGSPEGVVTASIGSTFRRTDGGTGTTFYVKESGTGSTGWVAK